MIRPARPSLAEVPLADLSFNADLATVPTDADSTLRLPVPDFRLTSVSICGRYSTDFDELRLGVTFFDVTPIVTEHLQPQPQAQGWR